MAPQSHNSQQSVLPQLVPLCFTIHSVVSWVISHEPLWFPFPQIYRLTANLSIIHIPNYRLQSAGWRQKHKKEEKEWKEGKNMLWFHCIMAFPTGSKGFTSPMCRLYQYSCSKTLCRRWGFMAPKSLSVKYNSVTRLNLWVQWHQERSKKNVLCPEYSRLYQ